MAKVTQHDVEEYIKDMNGKWHLRDLMLLLNLGKEEYSHLKTAVGRAKEKRLCKAVGGQDGYYQTIDYDYEILNFKTLGEGYFNIKYPLGLERYFKTPRHSVIVVGGSASAGKTAFAHNIIELNWKEHEIVCWDSENSGAELNDRLSAFGDFMEWPDDLFRSRSDNYEDIILPDALNIIDYLEVPENIWEIRRPLRQIRDKLRGGIAIVCLQKPEGRDLPYGKDWAKQLPRVVLAMESGKLKILKGKSWTKKDVNPDGLVVQYKLVGGEKFILLDSYGNPVSDYQEEKLI